MELSADTCRPGQKLGRRVPHDLTTNVTPEMLEAWYRRLIAEKYDGGRTT